MLDIGLAAARAEKSLPSFPVSPCSISEQTSQLAENTNSTSAKIYSLRQRLKIVHIAVNLYLAQFWVW
jgi:hypothetical protein